MTEPGETTQPPGATAADPAPAVAPGSKPPRLRTPKAAQAAEDTQDGTEAAAGEQPESEAGEPEPPPQPAAEADEDWRRAGHDAATLRANPHLAYLFTERRPDTGLALLIFTEKTRGLFDLAKAAYRDRYAAACEELHAYADNHAHPAVHRPSRKDEICWYAHAYNNHRPAQEAEPEVARA